MKKKETRKNVHVILNFEKLFFILVTVRSQNEFL